MNLLFFRHPFNRRFPFYDQFRIGELDRLLPPEVHFTVSQDPKLLQEADAVIFDVPFLPRYLDEEGIVKYEGQTWVGWCLECEQNYPWIEQLKAQGYFDLWMTYHQDADIVLPYYDYSFRDRLSAPPGPKDKDICMFISSPVNQSRRQEYLEELMGYIPIDSYGQWMNNCRLSDDQGYTSKLRTIARYKFTIAFENAAGTDYVTEKFFDPFLAGSVPVYWGAPNIQDFSPGPSSFIHARDYPSPRELASALREYCACPERYQELFAWKQKPLARPLARRIDAQKVNPFIRLAEMIMEQEKGGQ